MQEIDTDNESEIDTAWAKVVDMRRVATKVQPRRKLKQPWTLVGLPRILEDT